MKTLRFGWFVRAVGLWLGSTLAIACGASSNDGSGGEETAGGEAESSMVDDSEAETSMSEDGDEDSDGSGSGDSSADDSPSSGASEGDAPDEADPTTEPNVSEQGPGNEPSMDPSNEEPPNEGDPSPALDAGTDPEPAEDPDALLCGRPESDYQYVGEEACPVDFNCWSFENECGCGCLPEQCQEPDRSYVATSPDACAVIDFGCADGEVGFDDECGCGCLAAPSQVSDKCDLAEREYVSESPDQCAVIRFACGEGQAPFSDDCGCGCEPDGVSTEPLPAGEEAALCTETGGNWIEGSCGNYVCGNPPTCRALIPGCDCGPISNFDEALGCIQAPECGLD